MGWMIISFIIALLVLYKLSSILGFYDDNDGSDKKPKMKDLNSFLNLGEKNPNEENEMIKTKNLDIENDIFRLLNSESQVNIQKIHELDEKFNLSFIKIHSDSLFTILLKELYEGKFQNLEKHSNEIFFKKINDFLKEKKFNRILIKIDSIEILDIKLDEFFNAIISVNITSEQMEKIGESYISKVFENNVLIGSALKVENIDWIILDCANLID